MEDCTAPIDFHLRPGRRACTVREKVLLIALVSFVSNAIVTFSTLAVWALPELPSFQGTSGGFWSALWLYDWFMKEFWGRFSPIVFLGLFICGCLLAWGILKLDKTRKMAFFCYSGLLGAFSGVLSPSVVAVLQSLYFALTGVLRLKHLYDIPELIVIFTGVAWHIAVVYGLLLGLCQGLLILATRAFRAVIPVRYQ